MDEFGLSPVTDVAEPLDDTEEAGDDDEEEPGDRAVG
jgi:hypothetical protein